MLFKFIDEQGNKSVADYPDNSNFVINEDSNGMCYITVHLPGPRQKNELPVQRLVGDLDKEIANRCIDQIYDRLKTKSPDCDLTGIQRGLSNESEDNPTRQ